MHPHHTTTETVPTTARATAGAIEPAVPTAAPGRRDVIKGGGTIVGGGLLAGCLGGDSNGSGDTPANGTDDGERGSYEVCIPDRRCVAFESVPETWAAATPAELEIGMLLGQLDGFVGMFYPTYPATYYDALGIDLDTESKARLLSREGGRASVDREAFYETDPDVFLIDPNTLPMFAPRWSDADTRELETNVAPFIGHHGYHNPSRYMNYEPWPLMEYFGVIADVFCAGERYERARTLHDDLRERIRSQRPENHPSVAIVDGTVPPESGQFYPYTIEAGGWGTKPYRDAGARDAFDDLGRSIESIDYEVLVERDPDVIAFANCLGSAGLEATGDDAFRTNYLGAMRDGAGSELTAVQNGRVYPAGPHVQGPITTLYGMEAAAKQLYPDAFAGELFDRELVASYTATEVES